MFLGSILIFYKIIKKRIKQRTGQHTTLFKAARKSLNKIDKKEPCLTLLAFLW
jgi:hypothetical protein